MKKIINVLKIIMLLFILTNCKNKTTHIEGTYKFEDTNNNIQFYLSFNKQNKYYITTSKILLSDLLVTSCISAGYYKILDNNIISLEDNIGKFKMFLIKQKDCLFVNKGLYLIKGKHFIYTTPFGNIENEFNKIWEFETNLSLKYKIERLYFNFKNTNIKCFIPGIYYTRGESVNLKIIFYQSKKFEYMEDNILWSRGYYYYIDGFMYLYDLDLDFSFKAKVLSNNSIFVYDLPTGATNITFEK